MILNDFERVNNMKIIMVRLWLAYLMFIYLIILNIMFHIKIASKIRIYSGVSVNVFCDYLNDGDHRHLRPHPLSMLSYSQNP